MMNDMRYTFRLLAAAAAALLCLQLSAQPNDAELADPNPADPAVWAAVKTASFGWGNIDTRYAKTAPAETSAKAVVLNAWKGERVSAQAVLSTPVAFSSVKITASDLKSGKNIIPASAYTNYFVRYVLAEGNIRKEGLLLSADRLDPAPSLAVEAKTSRPVWFEIKVPADARPGLYKGTVGLDCDGVKYTLPIQLKVSDNLLPEPSEWAFHLDLWQDPYSFARYYQVPLWSKEHFDIMRPALERLAAAGQKVITTSIIQRPWDGQTFDPYESMVGKFKQIDGSWKYDYTVFDKWVEFAMSCGITEQIDCYTLVPWSYQFEYFDCATNCTKILKCQPGEKAYRDLLLPFLKDFAAHLKAKGWWGKTCIAMDERPMEQMNAALALVREADPGYRIEGAANYNVGSSEADGIFDMSVCYQYDLMTPETLARRRAAGQFLTFYTCCSPARPNTFTFSDPAESAVLGWHAAAVGYDGYLRWAYCSWVEQPNQDSRYFARTWPSGDCYLVYPGGTSIRFERLIEGIQNYEKVRILKGKCTPAQNAAIDAMLAKCFSANDFGADTKAEDLIAEANAVLLSVQNR